MSKPGTGPPAGTTPRAPLRAAHRRPDGWLSRPLSTAAGMLVARALPAGLGASSKMYTLFSDGPLPSVRNSSSFSPHRLYELKNLATNSADFTKTTYGSIADFGLTHGLIRPIREIRGESFWRKSGLQTTVSSRVRAMARNALQNVVIVLVGTKYAGNVGAVARAMHNMGLEQLRLVAPELSINAAAVR